ncbi:MAG: hypothetical protein M1833_001471 [Piccolia ochrophora]|nr:MAG: hypothetical protein M1833_001471 [Piccolia ochrophora]
MRPRAGAGKNDAELDEAATKAAWGAVMGAVKWGLFAAAAGAAGYAFSPVYRGLTLQFKLYLQVSGMTVGSMIEADRRLREHEGRVRRDRKIKRDAAVWRDYEQGYERQAKLARKEDGG